MWGVLQEGWHERWGADADHLKTFEHVDAFVAAGYTFFTFDPGDHVDGQAHTAPLSSLQDKFNTLPWEALKAAPNDLQSAYVGKHFRLDGGLDLTFSEEALLRAASKYGRAIAHIVSMYRHLSAQYKTFELEISLDETETPTSPLEHYFVVNELRRLEVHWVSLAPRYVGSFEKGVDYIGDLREFEASLAQHAAIARSMGPYKISLHSGSDKFSLYPILSRQAGRLVHLKTAGTSYLEALRVIAAVTPSLFRRIYVLAFERYGEDRATYHLSADPARAPQARNLSDRDLPGVLEQFDARQMLHATFGSALARFGDRIKEVLAEHEEGYCQRLESHLSRHFRALLQSGM